MKNLSRFLGTFFPLPPHMRTGLCGALRLANILVLAWGLLLPSATAIAAPRYVSTVATAGSRHAWSPPLSGDIEVLRDFEKPQQRWSPGHRGVDLASSDSAVYSPADGRVVFSGRVVDRDVITIEHSDGYRSTFEPVKDPLPAGTSVRAGERIADLDDSVPHCAQRCLHWGVYSGRGKTKEYVNPLMLIGLSAPSVLLPIGEDFSA